MNFHGIHLKITDNMLNFDINHKPNEPPLLPWKVSTWVMMTMTHFLR